MPNLPNNEMQRRSNWLQIVQNTIDQYDDPTHGVQKDAIQNGKDAIPLEGRKGDGTPKEGYVKKNWKFSFELKEVRPRGQAPVSILMMTDFGTTGLMGERRIGDLRPDERIPLEEKWARFEAYAEANEGGQTGGSRGQGKFVFVGASKRKHIIYDTRKINKKYRVGYTTVSVGGSPVVAHDDKEGEKWIREEWGIEPVHQNGTSGTRIIIVDPSDDLIARLKSGAFLENIQETWWPFIRDCGARIEVTVDGVTSTATIPDLIKKLHVGKDSVDIKHWNKDGLEFKFGQWAGHKYTIKEFRIASVLGGNLPDAYKGIAVFRGGMKVQAVQPLYGYDFDGRISGYILLDPKSDEKLREIEKPSHYEFNNSGIWKKLEAIIKEQSQRFGVEKLGIGITNPISREEQRQASVSKALQIFQFLSKDWPLDLSNGGQGPSSLVEPKTPVIKKDLCVVIKDLVFPNPANIARLDYGQKIAGLWFEVNNRKPSRADLQLECWVSSASGKIFDIENSGVAVEAESVALFKKRGDGFEILVDKDIFRGSGEYQIRARISDSKTKKIVDEVARRFWVEMDPPLRAPFDMQPAAFSVVLPGQEELEWKLEFPEEGNVVYYNTDHPSFIAASRQQSEGVFLGELAVMAGIQLVISNIGTITPEEARLKKLPFDYDALFGDDPVMRYLETIKMRDRIRHKILSNYLT